MQDLIGKHIKLNQQSTKGKSEMGEGEELKTKPQAGVEIQERGEIFFLYRPKVEKQEVHGLEDVQRLYIILRPESGENIVEEKQNPNSGKEGHLNKPLHSFSSPAQSGIRSGGHCIHTQEVNIEKQPLLRFIIMGRKSLPHPSKKSQPYWGFVDMVTTNVQHVKTALQADEYDTSTRGRRHISAARALGEGIYRILRHNPHPHLQDNKSNYHTHLIYKLEVPSADENVNEPQKAFNVEREGSFVIQIKNPDQDQGAGPHQKRKAQFPAHLQGLFGRKRYRPADPPDYLNFEGCEFLLISASDDIEKELGLELKCENECDLVKTFGETVSTQPLFKGTWV